MKTVILAAGYGTRLYPLTKDKPKALIEILPRKTLLDILLEKTLSLDTEISIITNARFYKNFLDWKKTRKIDIEIWNDMTTSNEERLGAIGDLNFFIDRKNVEEDLLILGSDNLFDWGLEDFLKFSKEKSGVVLGLYDVRDKIEARRFGIAELDSQRRIIRLEEKPENPFSTLIGTCIYFFPLNCLFHLKDYLKESQGHLKDAPGYFFSWLSKREEVHGFVFEGRWFDIGTLDALKRARGVFRALRG